MAHERDGDKPRWDPDFEALMKVLLSEKGIKMKQASEVGTRKVMYFRGKDFIKFALENTAVLKKKCPGALAFALGEDNALSDEEEAMKLGSGLVRHEFCYRAEYAPLNEKAKSDKKLKKWPDRLVRTWNQMFESDGFYIMCYEDSNNWHHVYLVLVIAAVLLAYMFPAWPRWAKIGLWYGITIIPTMWFALIIGRVLLWVIFYVIGFDLWIFPNFLEATNFSDMFRPPISFYRLAAEDKIPIVFRMVIFVVVQWAFQQSRSGNAVSFMMSSYCDILNWGVDKITAPPVLSNRPTLPSMESFQNETDF